jgi:two-component system OmpR family sensor kinase
MLNSVRVRLTLWYSTVMALVLLVISLASYFIFWKSTALRTDADLVQLAEAFLVTFEDELKVQAKSGGIAGAARQAILEHRFRDHVLAVLDGSGAIVAASPDETAAGSSRASSSTVLSSDAFRRFVDAAREERTFASVDGPKGGYRGFAYRFSADGHRYMLVVLRSLHPQKEMLEEIRQTFTWVIPLAILLAAAGGYFLARKSLAPVVAMSAQAGRIGAANLHDRLSVKNERDELGRLAKSFNELLDRLDESFERQQRFMADASHELRTPVAILRGEAEVALSQPARRAEDYRESLAILHQEARRLAHIVEDLFTLTRADAGQYAISACDFYLEELVSDCVHSIRTLALAKRIKLTAEASEESPIRADEDLVRRMLLNLLDNAIKYTPEGGNVAVSCRRWGDEYALAVSDTGAGIPAELQPRIFERFFRADKARSRSDHNGGAGLGLAIARWVAEAHGGRLELTRSDANGSTFTVFLPATRVPALQPH